MFNVSSGVLEKCFNLLVFLFFVGVVAPVDFIADFAVSWSKDKMPIPVAGEVALFKGSLYSYITVLMVFVFIDVFVLSDLKNRLLFKFIALTNLVLLGVSSFFVLTIRFGIYEIDKTNASIQIILLLVSLSATLVVKIALIKE